MANTKISDFAAITTLGDTDLILIAQEDTANKKLTGSDLKTSMPLPKDHITGLVLSNDTDAEHDINITAGEARDSTDAEDIVLASEITKQIDAAWSVFG